MGPAPHSVSNAVGRICISDKFPGAAAAPGPGATLGESLEAGDCPPGEVSDAGLGRTRGDGVQRFFSIPGKA